MTHLFKRGCLKSLLCVNSTEIRKTQCAIVGQVVWDIANKCNKNCVKSTCSDNVNLLYYILSTYRTGVWK